MRLPQEYYQMTRMIAAHLPHLRVPTVAGWLGGSMARSSNSTTPESNKSVHGYQRDQPSSLTGPGSFAR